ncbi:MAG: PhoH family protein [Verrucomicrobiota bacterium]
MAELTLNFPSGRFLHQLYAGDARNLARIEERLDLKLVTRDDWVTLEGGAEAVEAGEALFGYLEKGRTQGLNLRQREFDYMLDTVAEGRQEDLAELFEKPLVIQIRKKTVVPKTLNQKRYLQAIQGHDIVFGAGPAGTGKTFLAMACAMSDLLAGKVEKIILTRPAVEAGEALGFLPGDLEEKILPYLRPLYDAMYEMLGKEDTHRLMERDVIEIAPLAYMRGRTLSRASIILDEAQNTTPEQMVMFLTRLGEGSRMMITGDITQIDLPRSKASGLRQAIDVLDNTEGIAVFFFDDSDVVRHPLVQRIINAYDRYHQADGRI